MKNNIYYRGNSNLKGDNVDLEYTPEQIEEVIKCREDVKYFIKKYVKIVTPNGLQLFELRNYQENIIDLIHNNGRCVYLSGRQSGKTATAAAYIAHYIIFNQYKNVAIVANKEETAKVIFDRVQLIYEHLPIWLKVGVREWNKKSLELDNGCTVVIGSSSSTSISGRSINLLYIDECGLIPKKMAEKFFDSVLPVVSADPNAKIVISSTPKGLNHFYRIWKEAESGRSGYKHLKVEWWEVPGRDEKFKEKIIREKGIEHWEQEYAVEFKGSGGSLIDSYSLKAMVVETPLESRMESKFDILEYPKPDRKYLIFVDTGEGVGLDESTCQVLDITTRPYKQVAVYYDNTVKIENFHVPISLIGEMYNTALVVIETNNGGSEVCRNLNYDVEYEHQFFNDDFGVKTTKLTKRLGCSQLKYLVESGQLILTHWKTIEQLGGFVRNARDSYSNEDGDDLVMPLVNFAYWINNKDFTNLWLDEENLSKILNKSQIDDINENLIPCSLFCDDGLDDD